MISIYRYLLCATTQFFHRKQLFYLFHLRLPKASANHFPKLLPSTNCGTELTHVASLRDTARITFVLIWTNSNNLERNKNCCLISADLGSYSRNVFCMQTLMCIVTINTQQGMHKCRLHLAFASTVIKIGK